VKKTDDGSKPCSICRGKTKIQLPCGSWVCLMEILGASDHPTFVTLAKAA
jgi:hypothetical protein